MKKILFMVLVTIICVPCVRAEKVFLKNGKVVQGRLAFEDQTSVILETEENKYQTIYWSNIEAIKPDEAASAAPDAVFGSDGKPASKKKTLKMLGEEVAIEGEETIVRIGMDTGGKLDLSARLTDSYGGSLEASGDEEIKNGFFIGAERYYYTSRLWGVGFGMAYDFPRKMKDYDGSFNFLDVYAAAKLRYFPRPGKTYLYAVGKFGWNLLFGDSGFKEYFGEDSKLSGGVYYGFGAGVHYDSFVFELLFSSNNGRAKIENGQFYSISNVDYDYSISYNKTNLSIGYAF